MGECGCGNYQPRWRLPGPGGIVYTIETYRGCDYCQTPSGVVIYRHDAETAASWGDEGVDVLPFVPYSGGPSGQFAITVFDHERMRREIAAHFADADEEEMADQTGESIADEIVDCVLPEVVSKSMWPESEARAALAALEER